MSTENKNSARIAELEEAMNAPDFWADKNRAQAVIRELQELKMVAQGGGKYDSGDAVMTIFSGAGGDDAEDFSRILFEMYIKFFNKKNFSYAMIHKNENDHGGFRNITMEVRGKGVYGTLKNESGVHRLVRVSPFNAKKLRHTSFSLVEVIPRFEKTSEVPIPEDEIKVDSKDLPF